MLKQKHILGKECRDLYLITYYGSPPRFNGYLILLYTDALLKNGCTKRIFMKMALI